MNPGVSLSLAFIVAILIVAASYLTVPGPAGECVSDSDCVAEQCCHPTSCVPKDMKPDCSRIFCTQECVPGTMDCRQGYCACLNGKCEAVIG